MEALENSMVEGDILWLVQTILESLIIPGKLDSWIRQVGLPDDIEKLRIEIERVETVVSSVKGRATGNKPLARSLARIRELLYDTDDMVDELDYFRLQQQVEGGATCVNEPEGADSDSAEQVDDESRENPNISGGSNKRKNRSKAWDHFVEKRDANGKIYAAECRSCGALIKCGATLGTNGLFKHIKKHGKCLGKPLKGYQPPNLTRSCDDAPTDTTTNATLDSIIRKRMRIDAASTLNVTTKIYPWNKDKFSKRIHQIAFELQCCRCAVIDFSKDSVASSDKYQINISDTWLQTTGLVPRKVYGRDAEKDYIIRVITAAKSHIISVLPIVGIAGVGKTAVAQLVYSDPIVESQFERVWVCVSYNFDEETLTRKILEFLSKERNEASPKIPERHEEVIGLGKLQEILKAHMQWQRKKFLLILDDVWHNLDDYRWKRLLLPLQSSHANGNVILVTTRNLSVAQRIGTEEPIMLGALENDEFGLLFKSFAFGDDTYAEHPTLNRIGQQIAEKLKGNPLAAETAGKILRERLNLEHWSRILKNEEWKSLQLRGGIMPALKRSYDQLPYHLQQCFQYCSIFPNNYPFLAKDLVRTWISLGFVRCTNSSKKLEETGRDYLTNLVNLCFFEPNERTKPTRCKTCYVICGIMHDFGRLVSRTEYATIDGLGLNEVLPTVRHLSIVIDSSYSHNQHGTILCDEKLEKNLQSVFESAGKLRTLVLLGNYDKLSFFQDMLQKAQSLRVLQISATKYEICSLRVSLVSPVHLRHLKLEISNVGNDFRQALSKWYHIQVLDLGDSRTILTGPIGMDNLVSLHHLIASESVYADSIGKVTSLHELNCAGCDITKLQSMSELVQLGVYKLGDVTRDEAYGARLKDKRNLENLHLSWKDNLSQDESDREQESTPGNFPGFEYTADTTSDALEGFEYFAGTASDVLEGLEPHHNLKYLRVSGYSGAESPAWLGASVSILQTLHLEDCGGWGELGFLGFLPFLTKLKLRNMQKVEDVSIPSLEELMLIKMPKLERCSCDSMGDLNSSLRVLKIERCRKLKVFPLLGSCGIEQKSWLFHLRELTIHFCPDLAVSHPLPPSSRICKLSVIRASKLPLMKGSTYGELKIQNTKFLAFHNLRVLSSLIIECFNYPTFFSLKGFRQLINLKNLEINNCRKLFLSDILQEDTYEDKSPENINALSSLKRLWIRKSTMVGLWLSVLLQNMQAVEELTLSYCDKVTGLFIENEESELSNLKSALEASSSYDSDDAGSIEYGLLHIPSKLISSLKKMTFSDCFQLTCEWNKDVFSKFTSLEELGIWRCPELISSCVHKDENDANGRWLLPQSLVKLEICENSEKTLQLCFPGHLTGLKRLEIYNDTCLESLQLHNCTALEELVISGCSSLTTLEGLPSLSSLRSLQVLYWPHLIPCSESLLSEEGYDMRPRLEILHVTDYSVLSTSFCRHLTSLRCLKIRPSFGKDKVTRLTDEQERALRLLRSLQELSFQDSYLEDLPMGLHSLPSLRKLTIFCKGKGISRLPEQGLPPSLEELKIWGCSKELADQCRMLATSKLKVRIK